MFLCTILPLFRAATASVELPLDLQFRQPVTSRLHNVHVVSRGATNSPIMYTYGSCSSKKADDSHHTIAVTNGQPHDRLLWRLPDSVPSGLCISAWAGPSEMVGRSKPVMIQTTHRQLRRSHVPMDNTSGIDTEGPWFDGVAALNGTNIDVVDATAAKSKSIAIIGAGMAGLMTWLCLNQSGMTNLRIIEGSDRYGGRVHTEYFGNPVNRLYQDMGAMRFPKTIHRPDLNISLPVQDHKLVFSLADELNRLNGNSSELAINFINWIESSESGLQCQTKRKPDGRCPTLRDIAADSTYTVPQLALSDEARELGDKISALAFDPNNIRLVATNLFKAHKAFLDKGPNNLGGDQWSEFGYMHNYLKYSLNATDQVLNTFLAPTPKGGPLWTAIYQNANFLATEWKTIDGGLSRLANAFHPHVNHLTRLNSGVDGLDFDEDKKMVKISWFTDPYQANDTFGGQPARLKTEVSVDYVITTVPLAIMRRWRLPEFSITKTDAINSYGYEAVCKVALKFQTRFWEHFDQPIYGSCSTTSGMKGIGSICYPSNDINSTGPGIMLASYTDADAGLRWASVPESEHVQYVVDAMADTHGNIVYEQYTGEYRRKCWILDRFSTVSWGAATVGQRQLYMPEFFRTEKGVILAGEGTSYSSAWVSSALESGIRSSVQLLLELGLVDEAKGVVTKWMANWISV